MIGPGQYFVAISSLVPVLLILATALSPSTAFLLSVTTGNRRHVIGSLNQQQVVSSSSSLERNEQSIVITIPHRQTDQHTTTSNNTEHDASSSSSLHSIHITSILSDEEAHSCWKLASDYGQSSRAFQQPDTERHTNYATCDFSIENCPTLQHYLEEDLNFTERIFDALSQAYPEVPKQFMVGFMDLFCVNYVASSNDDTQQQQQKTQPLSTQTMDRLEAHRDGSILSFNILLTPPDDFEGGGTFFDALMLNDEKKKEAPILKSSSNDNLYCPQTGTIALERAGDAILHCGQVLHGAQRVTKGERLVLVGFVDISSLILKEGVMGRASQQWGRMDVAQQRWERQEETKSSTSTTRNKWLPSACSSVHNVPSPNFPSIQYRANHNVQRQLRLRAEDELLHNILRKDLDELPSELLEGLVDGDITIL